MSKKLFLFFIFFSVVYLCLPQGSVFADLEINYPVLKTGETVTTQTTVPEYLKYVFDFSMFAGFLAVIMTLVTAGIIYFLSPISPGTLDKITGKILGGGVNRAKDMIWGAISGLIILLTLYIIITTINPALTIFKVTKLSKAPDFPPLPPQPGVLFYKLPNCPAPDPDLMTGSLPILGGELSNKIQSAKIIQGGAQGVYFVSILYEDPKFRGKCFYVDPAADPGAACQGQSPNGNIEPFASSASIDRYSPTAVGDVVFYRNADSNENGGYLTIDASDFWDPITGKYKGIYKGNLNELSFTGQSGGSCTVPKKEQDCVLWSKTLCPTCVIIDGKFCAQTQCPALAGDNIGSIKINGYYIVLFIYFDPKDKPAGPWSFCQAFPTPEDINNTGPQQIRWEDIKNNKLYKTPNWVALIPIEKPPKK
ncbi:MAG: hypothetical protein AAB361_00565 [Patescibacteria group bacterium]